MYQSNCGCNNSVLPQPVTSKKCVAKIEPIAQLVWLQGLDADNCLAYQRVIDTLGLKDCNGNPIDLTTESFVTCSDFSDQLCTLLSSLPFVGEADVNTILVGADCRLYSLPPSNPPTPETPNAVTDTTTINFSATGTLNRNISGDVIVSTDLGNVLEVHANGLYVPESGIVLDACDQIQTFPNGSDAVEGTVLIGADCQKHVLTYPEPLAFSDTATIDFTQIGSNVQAAAKVDPTGLIQITGSGLYLGCNEVKACGTNVTVTDTNTVNLTKNVEQISADVIISPNVGNALSALGNGLFVDVCSGLNSGAPPVPAVLGSTVLVGANCNRYTLPLESSINGVDTTTVNLTASNHTIQADVNVQPGTLLSTGPQGLQVTCEAAQDCIFNTQNNFWLYTDGADSVAFYPSADVGNLITNGSDGRPYVPAATLAFQDTDCISLTQVGLDVFATPIISPDITNIIQCRPDGLYAQTITDVDIIGLTNDCMAVNVTEPTVNNFEISVQPVISIDFTNALECRPDGLYVDVNSAIALDPDVCNGLSTSVNGLLAPADSAGNQSTVETAVIHTGAGIGTDVYTSALSTVVIINPSSCRSALLSIHVNIPGVNVTGAISLVTETTVTETFNLPGILITPPQTLTLWTIENNGGTPDAGKTYTFIVPPSFNGSYSVQTETTLTGTSATSVYVGKNGVNYSLVTI